MWDWIVNILFELLKLIQTFAVDWGLSIIILVVIIRLLLTPLMLKSTKSTARMQVLQPKMLEIQERYADDPQRQAEEMLADKSGRIDYAKAQAQLIEAMAQLKGVDIPTIQKALKQYDKEQKERILANPAVVARAAEIEAERAASTGPAIGLDDLLAA